MSEIKLTKYQVLKIKKILVEERTKYRYNIAMIDDIIKSGVIPEKDVHELTRISNDQHERLILLDDLVDLLNASEDE